MKALCLLFMCSWVSAFAADLTVKLSFDKRPTPSGMVYMLNDASLLDAGQQTVEVIQKGKVFIPRLVAAPKGGNIVIKNLDEIQHNVYADDKPQKTQVDLGMSDPNKDVTQKVTWEVAQVVKFGCRIHPNMQLWIANIPTKHHVCFDMEKNQAQYDTKIVNVPSSEHSYR
ncbi:MAG: hypothetical protein HRU15_08790, partial [Planctomycetes bacterium]|nr:hypothetical protein [Planctomycetota bacterium]